MSHPVEDPNERTMAVAEAAWKKIKLLRQPCTPRDYEVWYAYSSGERPSLNQSINEAIVQNGTLSPTDIGRIYSTTISSTQIADKVASIGSQLMDEIGEIASAIDDAASSNSSYAETLIDANEELPRTKDRELLRTIVKRLLTATNDLKQNHKSLEARLNESRKEIKQLKEGLGQIHTESHSDPTTSLWNRKYFDDQLAQSLACATERNEPLSLLFTDVDDFKRFNDTWGHLTGDQVLGFAARLLKQQIRAMDIAARYSGDAFAVILPRTELAAAHVFADNIRRAIMSKYLAKRSTNQNLGRMTISVGVALARKDDTPQSLIARTDACLYAAKHNGRNLEGSVRSLGHGGAWNAVVSATS